MEDTRVTLATGLEMFEAGVVRPSTVRDLFRAHMRAIAEARG